MTNISDNYIHVLYLGDGVYIGKNKNSHQITLFTFDGITYTNIIILDDIEITALVEYLRREFL